MESVILKKHMGRRGEGISTEQLNAGYDLHTAQTQQKENLPSDHIEPHPEPEGASASLFCRQYLRSVFKQKVDAAVRQDSAVFDERQPELIVPRI